MRLLVRVMRRNDMLTNQTTKTKKNKVKKLPLVKMIGCLTIENYNSSIHSNSPIISDMGLPTT